MKRILALTLALVITIILCPVVSAGAATNLTDFREIEHKEAVSILVDLGIINGLPDGSYGPDRTIDRASWAKLVATMLYNDVADDSDYYWSVGLTDVINNWAEVYINYLYLHGIVAGDGTGHYRPSKDVTVVEAAKILLTSMGMDAEERGYVNTPYWAENIMDDAEYYGVMDGIYSYWASKYLTRDDAAQMIYNVLDELGINVPTATRDFSELDVAEPEEDAVDYDSDSGIYYVDNILLVTFKTGVSNNDIQAVADYLDGQVVGGIPDLDMYQIEVGHYWLDGLNTLAEDVSRQFDCVLYATYDSVTPLAFQSANAVSPNDPWRSEYGEEVDMWDNKNVDQHDTNWWIKAVDAQYAWAYNNQLSPIKIGINDGSFDVGHEDLKNKCVFADEICKARNESVWVSTNVDKQTNAHGTHVAGIIGAEANNGKGLTGLVWNSQLVLAPHYKTENLDIESAWDSAIYGNLTRLVNAGAKVINYSQGKTNFLSASNPTYSNDYIERNGHLSAISMAKLIDQGNDFLVVQSAGNGRGDSGTPVDALQNGWFCSVTHNSITGSTKTDAQDILEHIIIVGAAEQHGNGYRCTDFSNFGAQVDICAPGKDIYSTYPGDIFWDWELFGSYRKMSGTSMAAPIVTGVCGLVWSADPSLKATEVREIVLGNTKDIVMPHPSSGSNMVYDMVNAQAAVECALRIESEPEVEVTEGAGSISGRVCIASDRSTPINNAEIVIYDNETNERQCILFSNESGNYSANLPAGRYYIEISADGFLPFSAFADITEDNETYMETFLMITDSGEGIGTASGTITNALTGYGVDDVSLDIYPGWNNNATSGAIMGTTTGVDGAYSITLPTGNYTIRATKDGFIDSTINIIVQSGTTENQNGSISPIISGDNFRFVLTWGETPYDLDSHLRGTLSNGNSFEVYFSDKDQSDGEIHVCNLDVDDTSSYGPETTTLNAVSSGPYYYYVHRYSSNGSLLTSEAQVKVYQGESLVATFNVPTDQEEGRYWNVFAIVNGRLVAKNTITNNPDISYAD